MKKWLALIRVKVATIRAAIPEPNQRQKRSIVRGFYKVAELSLAGFTLAGILHHDTSWYVISGGLLGAVVAFAGGMFLEGHWY